MRKNIMQMKNIMIEALIVIDYVTYITINKVLVSYLMESSSITVK